MGEAKITKDERVAGHHTGSAGGPLPAGGGVAGNIAKIFLRSKITPLLIIASLFLGVLSVLLTAKEEDPDIVVPLVDIFIPYPGADVKDVEKTVTAPLEKLMWEIPGVKYVYSTAMNDVGLVTVRFKVGEDVEKSIIRLKTKIDYNMDRMPQGVLPPLIKSRSIYGVAQVTVTLWSTSPRYGPYMLRRIADEVKNGIKSIRDVSEISIVGGYKRVIRVEPGIEKLKSHGLDLLKVFGALSISNNALNPGEITTRGKEVYIRAGGFFQTADDVKNLVIGAHKGKPVFLRDVAAVYDGPGDPHSYHMIGFNEKQTLDKYQAVTIAISKRKGSDSVVTAEAIIKRIHALEHYVIPQEVHATITRNYGKSAYDKVRTLMGHIIGAILAVMIVMTIWLGWRAGLVVFVALPVTFSLTLFIYYMLGYTLNRVTLFALIFVVGLVVDDAIIVVENMDRHFKISRDNLFSRALYAVGEVGNPTILATITVIVAIFPMAFVGGLMGPYMKPMPVGASLAMIFSLFVAFTITPWLAFKLLTRGPVKDEEIKDEEEWLRETRLYRLYNRILSPFMEKKYRMILLAVTAVLLFLGAFLFIPTQEVIMKMLPFDNKDDLEVVIDMPKGTPLEKTTAVATDIGTYLSGTKDVDNYQIYAGIAAPFNFNGLVRHYYLRRGGNVAQIVVNFVDKEKRRLKSHDLAEILRGPIQAIGKPYGANIKIAEVPPGPPVLSPLVAQVYGPDEPSRIETASKIKKVFESTQGVVDVDWFVEHDMMELDFRVDKAKAALTGISTEMISKTLYMAIKGMKAGILHTGRDRESVDIIVKVPRKQKSQLDILKDINLVSMAGKTVSLSELVQIREKIKEKPIYHQDLKPVVYVVGDVAGAIESPVYAILKMRKRIESITSHGRTIEQYWTREPGNTQRVSMKWGGEWKVTYEVFRDLGLAFFGAMIIMYFVLVAWFGSFATPIIMMIPIPLSLIGIIPGHFLFGKFFTATSMIGFIALAGIMVRNAVLLIDFIEIGLERGKGIKDAVIESGAVRTRPVVLTTVAVIVGAFFMLPDPIFAGLGVSLISGAAVSTILTLVIIPLGYYVYYRMVHRS
jgi:multidrug efflux pump subunit AcrB